MKYAIKSILAAVGLLAMAGNAVAGNGHSYNGSYCDNYFTFDSDRFHKTMTGITNAYNDQRVISCPILVDEVGTTTGTSSIWVHFTGIGRMVCAPYSNSHSGTDARSTYASRTNTGWLKVPNITGDYFLGSYSMYCQLPPGGTLNTIRIIEKN